MKTAKWIRTRRTNCCHAQKIARSVQPLDCL